MSARKNDIVYLPIERNAPEPLLEGRTALDVGARESSVTSEVALTLFTAFALFFMSIIFVGCALRREMVYGKDNSAKSWLVHGGRKAEN